MTVAADIAEMFGNDGQNYLARGEYLSETRTLNELCDLRSVKSERGKEVFDEDGYAEYEVCYEGNITRYEFSDGSAIVDFGFCWDIEGDEKFSSAAYNS